jgi:hypothetical protein
VGQGDDCKGQGAITLILLFLVVYPTGLKNGYASRKTIFNPTTLKDNEMKSRTFSILVCAGSQWSETFEKCPILVKVKEGDNFNRPS